MTIFNQSLMHECRITLLCPYAKRFSKSLQLLVGIMVSSPLFWPLAMTATFARYWIGRGRNDRFIGFWRVLHVSHDEPASEIKVSQQMAARGWCKWKNLQVRSVRDDLSRQKMIENSEYRSFSIDPDNVDAVIGRPDRVLVLAHVKPVYANIDPLLDSEYLSHIYRGAKHDLSRGMWWYQYLIFWPIRMPIWLLTMSIRLFRNASFIV